MSRFIISRVSFPKQHHADAERYRKDQENLLCLQPEYKGTGSGKKHSHYPDPQYQCRNDMKCVGISMGADAQPVPCILSVYQRLICVAHIAVNTQGSFLGICSPDRYQIGYPCFTAAQLIHRYFHRHCIVNGTVIQLLVNLIP